MDIWDWWNFDEFACFFLPKNEKTWNWGLFKKNNLIWKMKSTESQALDSDVYFVIDKLYAFVLWASESTTASE